MVKPLRPDFISQFYGIEGALYIYPDLAFRVSHQVIDGSEVINVVDLTFKFLPFPGRYPQKRLGQVTG